MDAAEIARRAAALLHEAAVARGGDPTRPLDFALAEAERRDIEVFFVAPNHPELHGGKAAYDHQAGHILVDREGSDFQKALFIAHEIGHVELEGAGIDDVLIGLDPAVSAEAQSAAERVVDYSRRERREVRMDLFAREFLLPRSLLRGLYFDATLSRQDIASRYQAPLDILTAQLLDAVLLPIASAAIDAGQKPEKPLDRSQQNAADQTGPAFQLQAGPGTGKTQTLVHHVAALLDKGIPPEHILVLTFSNKAAAELIERLQQKHPTAAAGIWAGTFHSFGLDIIRRFHDRFGLPEAPRLIDPSQAIELLEDELARLPLRHYRNLWDPTHVIADLLAGISRAKDEVVDPARYSELAQAMLTQAGTNPDARERADKCVEVAQVYEVYQKLLHASGMVDFGDLVAMPVRLVETDAEARTVLADRHRHIIVDEYQDVNRASVRLLQQLRQPGNRIWVVGDARQSIYRFRGASAANMAHFSEDFSGAVAAPLAVNYRSRTEIVDTFQSFAKDMRASAAALPIKLEPKRGKGVLPKFRTAGTPEDEIGVVAAAIEDAKAAGRSYRDQAVLCASNGRLAQFASGLEARGIPVLYLGSLFDRPEIKSLLSLLSLLQDRFASGLVSAATLSSSAMPLADVQTITSHLRKDAVYPGWQQLADTVPLSPWGKDGLAALVDTLARFNAASAPWEVLTALVLDKPALARSLQATPGVPARMQAIAIWQLLAFAQVQPPARGAPIRRLLDRIRRLMLISDDRELRHLPAAAHGIDAVHLMTIHGSKGLEFPVVHLPDLIVSKMPLPHRAPRCPPPDGMIAGTGSMTGLEALKDGHEQEQECVFFVALSRARDELHLSASSLMAGGKKRSPSPYLDRISSGVEVIRTPRMIAGPPLVSGTVQVTWEEQPALTDHQLAQYEKCPRRFFFTHVLSLGGRRSETPFGKMHDALQAVLDWLGEKFPAANPSPAAAAAELDAAWSRLGPADHPFAAEYRRIAGELLSYLIAARSTGRLVAAKPLTLELGQSRVTVLPNHVLHKEDGGVIVRKVKTGKLASDEFDTFDYTVLLLAARDAYGPATVVEAVHLTSATTTPAEVTPRALAGRKAKAEAALAEIGRGAFGRKPNDRACPRCPHLFHCGALPPGAISAKI